METWQGFTSDDLKQLTALNREIKSSRVQKVSNLSKKTCSVLPDILHDPKEMKPQWDVPEEARLSNRTGNEGQDTTYPQNQLSSNLVEQQHFSESVEAPVQIVLKEDNSYEIKNSESSRKNEQKAILVDTTSRESQMTSLDIFQEKQKLMEQQNKRKKELLKQAIAQRKRQTQTEAVKLIQVQEELNRLDALLSADVSILRDEIEQASHQFNEAQKRYDRAESEFIEAKFHLFAKLERKELLTEHLCKIIEANERRKAKKLTELMEKLQIKDDQGCGVDLEPPILDYLQTRPKEASTLPRALKLNETVEKKNKANETLSSDHSHGYLNELEDSGAAVDDSRMAVEENKVLNSINLITAENLSSRNENVPSYENI